MIDCECPQCIAGDIDHVALVAALAAVGWPGATWEYPGFVNLPIGESGDYWAIGPDIETWGGSREHDEDGVFTFDGDAFEIPVPADCRNYERIAEAIAAELRAIYPVDWEIGPDGTIQPLAVAS